MKNDKRFHELPVDQQERIRNEYEDLQVPFGTPKEYLIYYRRLIYEWLKSLPKPSKFGRVEELPKKP